MGIKGRTLPGEDGWVRWGDAEMGMKRKEAKYIPARSVGRNL